MTSKPSENRNRNSKGGKPWPKPSMVDWYAPMQLLTTGFQTFLSTRLGAMIDSRRFTGMPCPQNDCVHDFSRDKQGHARSEISFDFMADTGDGWQATFTMAYLLTLPVLGVEGADLPRADFVILGGDQVYPVASKDAYARRLVWPWKMARQAVFEDTKNRVRKRPLFIIPGNHDWYDSLGAFSHRFLAWPSPKPKVLGGFKVEQRRSYFVIKLPHDWQIWALDIQLDKALDAYQDLFFQEHAETLTPKDKIILCSAEPGIVYSGRSNETLNFHLGRIMKYAENKGARVLARIAGDVHNYQHYVTEHRTRSRPAYPQHQIVSGGGGAFLHPTHAFPGMREIVPDDVETAGVVDDDPENDEHEIEDAPEVVQNSTAQDVYKPTKVYPSARTSFRLSFGLFAFAFQHLPMSTLLGGIYLLMFAAVKPGANWRVFTYEYPGATLLMLLVLGGCVAFAGLKGPPRFLLGLVHAAGHITLAWLSWRTGIGLTEGLVGPSPQPWFAVYLRWLITFVSGGLLGGTFFGSYLWATLHVLQIHQNEAFSALAIPHYKNFLRCRIMGDGSLSVTVVGVDRIKKGVRASAVVPRKVEEFRISSQT